jgi:hypothetical protein
MSVIRAPSAAERTRKRARAHLRHHRVTIQQSSPFSRAVVPELFSDAMSFLHRLLPRAVGPEGDVAAPGHSLGPDWAPSPMLAPMYAAAKRNNQL